MKLSNFLSLVIATGAVLTSALTISDITSKAATTFAKRDTVSDILTDIEDAASCTACEARELSILRPSDGKVLTRNSYRLS
jgi:sphingomyelin phosphodiesterase